MYRKPTVLTVGKAHLIGTKYFSIVSYFLEIMLFFWYDVLTEKGEYIMDDKEFSKKAYEFGCKIIEQAAKEIIENEKKNNTHNKNNSSKSTPHNTDK